MENVLITGWKAYKPCKYIFSSEILDEEAEELQAPVFIKPLDKTVTAKEHHPVVLECCVEGIPRPTIAWFRQSTPIPTETPEFVMTYEDDIARLTVLTMYPEDSGQYTCVAKNQAGTDSTQTELLVEGDKSEI